MGQAPEGSTYNQSGEGLPLISGAGDFVDGKVVAKKFTREPVKLCQAGDIIIGIRASIGERVWADRTYCLGRGVAGLRPNPQKLLSNYLWHYIGTQIDDLASKGRGSTFKQVNRGDIASMPLPAGLPKIDEQRRIAAILEKADDIREWRRSALALAEDLLRSAFDELSLLPTQDGPRAIGDIATVSGGITINAGREQGAKTAPYLRVANVFRDRLDLTEVKMTNVSLRELELKTLAPGDVLVVEGHGNPNEVGRAAVWDGSIAGCVHQNHIIRIRVDPKIANAEYLCAWINSDEGRANFFRAGKTTSGLNTINISQVRETELKLPPLAKQQQFARLRNLMHVRQQVMISALAEAEALYASLADRAFNGEL